MRLGVDFGTTRSVVAAVQDGRYPVASFATDDGFVDYLPGIATWGPAGLAFGNAASARLARADGHRTPLLRSVKAAITGIAPEDTAWELPGGSIAALDLVTDYLRYLRGMLLDHSNLEIAADEPLQAMVAVPAQASTSQRYLTLEAFARAGFEVLGLVSEPTAGAIEYARNSLNALSERSPKRYVVVYDLGGGTFDAAAVSLRGRRFELIGAEGVARLGGNDFDEVIASQVLAQLETTRAAVGDRHWAHLLERCRVAKESLSTSSRRLLVDVDGLWPQGEVVLDTSSVYAAAEPLVQRSIESLQQLFDQLAAQGIDPRNSRELGAIYLVGGSVQFPAVQRLLRQQFARKVQLAPQPHASTAIGLAVAADDSAGIFVREAATRHFGVWREGDGGREKRFDALIAKRSGADATGTLRVERRYRPTHRVGLLRFVECSQLDADGQPSGDVTPWQQLLFPYDPTLSASSDLARHAEEPAPQLVDEDIVETYEYSPAGMVRVSIENRSRGYRRDYVLGQGTH
jgi:molecular chaperone DnaK (HSP70)